MSSIKSSSGNVLFIVLIAAGLFAALGYAVTQSSRGGGPDTSKEKGTISSSESAQYLTLIENSLLRMKSVNGCDDFQVSYETPSGKNPNPNAPTDKRCHVYHPLGGGVPFRDIGDVVCKLEADKLTPGKSCGSSIYIGTFGGKRIFTTKANNGNFQFGSSGTVTSATSSTNGLANTNLIVSLGITTPAANSCRSLGPDWYLPSHDELMLLYNNRTLGDLNGSFLNANLYYATSTEISGAVYRTIRFTDGASGSTPKTNTNPVRCMRRE